MVSAPGPDVSPCIAASVASWRPRERSPHVGAAVPASSGEAGHRAEAAGWHGGAGEGAARGDRRRQNGPQSRSSGAADGAGADWVTVDVQSRSLIFFSFPYPTGAA
jgi:hypothetical protein